ncbi:hypothetical protein, partial [Salmonella enterica]|uniref:hypothetical protein n=1 Tax=Salmonella enterica TaxID=28901 RepID=UPI0032119E4E
GLNVFPCDRQPILNRNANTSVLAGFKYHCRKIILHNQNTAGKRKTAASATLIHFIAQYRHHDPIFSVSFNAHG